MSYCIVLNVRLLPESLGYRFYHEKLGEDELLDWWVDRITAYQDDSAIYLLCHSEADREQIEGAVHRAKVSVYKASRSSLMPALAEFVQTQLCQTIAIVPLGICLAPEHLLRSVYAHHASAGNAVTFVSGLPLGVAPTFMDKHFLQIASASHSLETADANMLANSLRDVPGDVASLVRQSKVFNAEKLYLLDETKTSKRIRIEKPKDVEILRRVHQRLARDGNDGLTFWKEEAITQSAESRCALRPTTPRPNPRRSRRKPTILFVSNPSGFAGAERSLCTWVEHVDPREYDKQALVSFAGTLTTSLGRAGAKVTCRGEEFAPFMVENYLYLRAFLRDMRPSIIHLNGLDGLPLLCAASDLQIPLVQHVRVDPSEYYAEYLQSAASVITVSEFVRHQVLKFDVAQEKVHTIPNGLSARELLPSTLSKEEARQMVGIAKDVPVVLVVARFHPQKRHDVVLKGFAQARRFIPSLHLVLNGETFGRDKYHDAVRAQAEALGLTNCITWIPWVSEPRCVYAAADALVSCGDHEAYPRCVVEAMAEGVPVVVANTGGHPELVSHGKTGLIFEQGDIDSLAAALQVVLTDQECRARLAGAAREHALEKLAFATRVPMLSQIYQHTLAGASDVSTMAWLRRDVGGASFSCGL